MRGNDIPTILTVEQACEVLKVSRRQLRRWRAAGLIEPLVSLHRPRYDLDDLLSAAEHLGRVSLPR